MMMMAYRPVYWRCNYASRLIDDDGHDDDDGAAPFTSKKMAFSNRYIYRPKGFSAIYNNCLPSLSLSDVVVVHEGINFPSVFSYYTM